MYRNDIMVSLLWQLKINPLTRAQDTASSGRDQRALGRQRRGRASRGLRGSGALGLGWFRVFSGDLFKTAATVICRRTYLMF